MARTPLTLPFSGAKLRGHRERKGWHQADLERECTRAGHRVGRARISRIETGACKPTPPQLTAIVAALEIQVDDLLDPS